MCPTQTPSFVWSASKVSRRRFTLHKPTTIVTSCPSTALEQLGGTRFRACWRGRGKASRRWLGRDGSSYSSLTPVDHHQVSTISRFVRGFKKRETRTTIPPTKPIHSRQNFFSPVSMRLARARYENREKIGKVSFRISFRACHSRFTKWSILRKTRDIYANHASFNQVSRLFKRARKKRTRKGGKFASIRNACIDDTWNRKPRVVFNDFSVYFTRVASPLLEPNICPGN